MKNQNRLLPALTGILFRSFLFFSLMSVHIAHGQEKYSPEKTIKLDGDVVIKEKALREKMKNDGVSEFLIDKFVAERKLINARESSAPVQPLTKGGNLPVPFALCSDMGAENGWGAWQAATGTANSGSQTWGAPFSPPTAPRFNLTSGGGFDACTPNAPRIPVVAPGFGNNSILLGQPQAAGAQAEKLVYQLTVTPQNVNFIFAYAIVLQNPGHVPSEQPFVSLCIKDQNGLSVPCGCFTYVAAPGLPGFYSASSCGALYKPWTTVGVNLTNYVGTTVTITILNVDCAGGGHWAHSYWDFSCGKANEPEYCSGQQVTLCAPLDSSIVNTYQWGTGATTQCITVTPNPNDTFSVDVQQPSGCNYNMMYVPKDTCLTTIYVSATSTPDTCSTNTGTATATVWNGAAPYTFLWSNGKTTQTVTGLAAGTYTITVTDVNNLTATNTVVVGNSILGVVSSITPVSCFGGNNGSATATVSGGISPITYLWINSQTTQTATGLTSGTYSVVVTDASGCSVTLTVLVPGAPMLNSNVNYTPSSCFTCPDGSAITNIIGGTLPYTYKWSPGGQSTPNITGILPGAYTVCVTDANGCTACSTINVLFLGVNEIFSGSVSISPTPSSGNLLVDFGNNVFGRAEVFVSDMIGRSIFAAIIPASGKQGLNLSEIGNGIYFMKVKTDKGSITQKLIIQK